MVEVRDAAPRIEDEGRDEGAGGAGVEAAGARAAALGHGGVGHERERGDDLAEELVAALAGRDHQAVLADEAEARARGPGALEDGLDVREHPGPRSLPEAADERGEPAQLLAEEDVVVLPARVAGDGARERRVALLGRARPRVAAADADDAARALEDVGACRGAAAPRRCRRGSPWRRACPRSTKAR